MKTRTLLTTLALFFGGLFISQAQIEPRIGAMLVYGTEIDNPGIGVNGEFGIAESFTIAPSLVYYFPKKSGSVTINWWELNADAHYYFLEEGDFTAYGLGGLNYTKARSRVKRSDGGSYSGGKGELGVNLGAGANFNLNGNLTPFAEIKYVIGNADHLVIGAGVRIDL